MEKNDVQIDLVTKASRNVSTIAVNFKRSSLQKKTDGTNISIKNEYISYKDPSFLKGFLNWINSISKKSPSLSTKQQKMVANQIKIARFLALLPYLANSNYYENNSSQI